MDMRVLMYLLLVRHFLHVHFHGGEAKLPTTVKG